MHCEGQGQQFLGDQPTTKRKHTKGDMCTQTWVELVRSVGERL